MPSCERPVVFALRREVRIPNLRSQFLKLTHRFSVGRAYVVEGRSGAAGKDTKGMFCSLSTFHTRSRGRRSEFEGKGLALSTFDLRLTARACASKQRPLLCPNHHHFTESAQTSKEKASLNTRTNFTSISGIAPPLSPVSTMAFFKGLEISGGTEKQQNN